MILTVSGRSKAALAALVHTTTGSSSPPIRPPTNRQFASRAWPRFDGGMATVRIRKHEAVPQTGSYEVCFGDGRPSVYFYWDDIAGRRLGPDRLTGAEALEKAQGTRESGV